MRPSEQSAVSDSSTRVHAALRDMLPLHPPVASALGVELDGTYYSDLWCHFVECARSLAGVLDDLILKEPNPLIPIMHICYSTAAREQLYTALVAPCHWVSNIHD